MSTKTPLNDERMAYVVAALPLEYGATTLTQLFRRGYKQWVVDGEEQPEDLLADIERFGTSAFKEHVRLEAKEEPFVDDPAMLAVLATLSSICVLEHPRLEEIPPHRLALIENIRELYERNVIALVRDQGDFDLVQDIAEVLYRKPHGEDGPHPGRVCTGIKQMPEFDDGFYIEIPMVAASRSCLVRSNTEYDPNSDGETDNEILTRVQDNHLYVPIGDLDQKYHQYAEQAFAKLLRIQEDSLTEDQHTWLAANEEAITERIDRFFDTGHLERVWKNYDPNDQKTYLILKAIKSESTGDVQVGEYYTAKEIHAALEDYDPSTSRERGLLNSITSPRSIAKLLTGQDDHAAISIQEGRPNEYKFHDTSGSVRTIDITDVEDLFELPCMAKMDERLQEKKPVLKDLYNFVRMVMWLPQYQNSDLDEVVEDIKRVFSRWPWYDEQITGYQVRYEFENTIDGDTPLPMNCSNDDMQRYCIGQEQCPYSIWGSLPFPNKMYT